MATAGQIITKAKRHLLSGTIEERNRLTSNINSSTTSVVLDFDLAGFREGTVFEIDSELFYVWSTVPGTKTLTVERAYDGTTAAAHTGGAIATLTPRFPRTQMLDAINSELDDLSSAGTGVYAVTEVSLTYSNGASQLDLTAASNVLDLLNVRYRRTATEWVPVRGVYLQRGLPTTDFASGYALTFTEAVPSGTLRVEYSKQFTHVTSESDDMQTVALLPATCEDIIEYGVALCVMVGREVKRTFTESQGETRRSDEVPSGATNQSMAPLRAYRRDRIDAEARRLAKKYVQYNRR